MEEVTGMVSVFDLDRLSELLKDFFEISHIRITVFDENRKELISYPENVAPYCSVIRGTLKGVEACMACDRQACEAAAKKHGTWIYQCHAGLTEAVTPLYVGDILAGYLLFGHAFSYASHEEGWKVIQKNCAGLSVNERMLREAVFSAEKIGEDYVRSAAHILHAVASYLILERMATLQDELLAVRLDAYLNAHYTDKLTAAQIANHLAIGKTQLYELSRQLYGCGTAAHIRALRVEKAKKLLREQRNMAIAAVSSECGFSDYNYFFTVFSRETGYTPKEWREKVE